MMATKQLSPMQATLTIITIITITIIVFIPFMRRPN